MPTLEERLAALPSIEPEELMQDVEAPLTTGQRAKYGGLTTNKSDLLGALALGLPKDYPELKGKHPSEYLSATLKDGAIDNIYLKLPGRSTFESFDVMGPQGSYLSDIAEGAPEMAHVVGSTLAFLGGQFLGGPVGGCSRKRYLRGSCRDITRKTKPRPRWQC